MIHTIDSCNTAKGGMFDEGFIIDYTYIKYLCSAIDVCNIVLNYKVHIK